MSTGDKKPAVNKMRKYFFSYNTKLFIIWVYQHVIYMRIIKRYTCNFKQCRSLCQDIHDKHLLYVLKKSFYRSMNLVPFHAGIQKIFRGGGGHGYLSSGERGEAYLQ